MIRKFLVIVFILFSFRVHSVSTYYLLVDPKFSPYASAPAFILLHKSLQMVEDDLIKNMSAENPYLTYLARASDLLFIWEPINELMVATQKEIFGEGYQGRELPVISDLRYKIRTPFPYGKGGGDTDFSIQTDAQVNDLLLMDIAGVNSLAILAGRIKGNLMDVGSIDGREASFYIESQQNLTTSLQKPIPSVNLLLDQNSLVDYFKWLAIAFPGNQYDLKATRRLSFLNFIDPLSFYALFSAAMYIAKKTPTKIYGIPIGSINYLPNMRLGLAPYGPEIIVENFVNLFTQTLYFYLKGNQINDQNTFGLGIEYPKLIKHKYITIGFRLDLWKQIEAKSPYNFFQAFQRNQLGLDNGFYYKNLYGGALSVILEQRVPGSPVSLYGQLGVKNRGFLVGETFKGGPILRAGLGITF